MGKVVMSGVRRDQSFKTNSRLILIELIPHGVNVQTCLEDWEEADPADIVRIKNAW